MNHKLNISFIRYSIISIIILLAFGVRAQQIIHYTGNWGQTGFNVEQSDATGMTITFSVKDLYEEDVVVDGQLMKSLGVAEIFLPNNSGAPNLPGTGRYIAIPQGATASFEILGTRTETISNIDVAPAPVIPKENENGLIYHKNMDIYSQNALYPANPVILSGHNQIRGVDAVILGFTPFQYNPVTKNLVVYKDIRVRVNFAGGINHFGNDQYRSRWFDPLLQDMMLNQEMLPKVNYNKSKINTDDVGFEYLIIVPNDPVFHQWADTIKKFRTEQGINTGIVTLADIGGYDTTSIKNYISNAYNNWTIKPVAILLLGDYGTDPNNTIISPIWDYYCASDNLFGDVNHDMMPEIVMTRMTAQNADQLQVMVRKFIDYERYPPTDPNFYAHPIAALGWSTDRWFQICTEVIEGFWTSQLNKTPVRINAVYYGNPASDPWSTATNTSAVVSYFGPSGLNYIPATPQALGGWTGGDATAITNALNAGAFMLQHRDHGFEQGWGEPSYSSSDIDSLHNTNLSFIMSVNCLTGKFNYTTEVFAEKFHRYTYNGQPAGALGLIAASETSYSFVNDAYVWGCYDNMWPNFMPAYGIGPATRGIYPAFANASGKYFLQQSSWPYNTSNKEVTYNLFHHFGDAFLNVYSEVPQYLTVSHNPIIYTGVISFDVTANPDALICLSLNGQILGTGLGTGNPVSISIPGNQLPPDHVHVVVTKQNYYRYEADVLVVPPTGPYVVKDSYTVNDVNGNNNGQVDFGENISLSVTVKNVGVAVANNVIVSMLTTDPFITLTDSSENYGDINPNALSTVPDGFSFLVSDAIPDAHVVNFVVHATSGSTVWTSSLHLTVNAPELSVGSVVISDPGGNNNGKLDPGETADIIIQTKNDGHADAVNTTGSLTCSDPNITLNNSTVNLNSIGSGNTSLATFNVSVSFAANIGDNSFFTYTANSGNYEALKSFYQTIGLVSEDWETGNFLKFPWITTSYPWIITNVGPYQGTYSAISGAIPNNAFSVLSVSFTVISEDSISFYRKVSSELNYDFLIFKIDNNELGSWSGEVPWGRVAFPVSAGNHTFSWTYSKDPAVTGGSDCAWIDYILFPPITTGPAPLAGTANAIPPVICVGHYSQLIASLQGGNAPFTFSWSPANSLNNPAIANPLANPTSTTTYNLTVTDVTSHTITASVTLVVDPCAGIDENNNQLSFEIFPNPNDGNFSIKLTSQLEDLVNIRLINSIGMLVYSEEQVPVAQKLKKSINLYNVTGGLYYLMIKGKTRSFSRKIMIMN